MTTADGPTSRALLTLDLLQASPGISAERLGRKLGVSERAARRCVATLREAGIPIESTRGPYGGYRLGRGLRLPPLTFNATEALGLVMAVLDGHHRADDPTDPVGSALGKIIRALPEAVAAQAEAVRRHAATAPDRSAARPDPGITTALVEACAASRQVRIGYRSESGSAWEGDVDPWSVVVRHGRWYLLCHSHLSAAQRAYRIDRVESVTLLEAEFRPPADLDPVAALEEHLAAGWEYQAEVVFGWPLDRISPWVPGPLGRLESLDDDSTRLVGSTGNPWWYAEQLAGIPAPMTILGGPELRASARQVGQRLVEAVDASV